MQLLCCSNSLPQLSGRIWNAGNIDNFIIIIFWSSITLSFSCIPQFHVKERAVCLGNIFCRIFRQVQSEDNGSECLPVSNTWRRSENQCPASSFHLVERV